MEGTTLASALLVGFYNTEGAVEAGWKYLMVCTVGIAFALVRNHCVVPRRRQGRYESGRGAGLGLADGCRSPHRILTRTW